MKNKSLILSIIVLFLVTILVWKLVVQPKDSILDHKEDITVQLQWFAGAQFIGLYVAKEKRFFLEEDIMVKINPLPNFTSDPIAILNDGRADIALSTADQVLINREEGKDIKAIGTVFNRSLACYTYIDNGSINSGDSLFLQDKVAAVYKRFDTENILLCMKKKNKDIGKGKIIQAPGSASEALLAGEFDFLGSYLINEPISLSMAGSKVKYIDPQDYGVNFYSDTYTVLSSSLLNNRETFVKFIKAANKGWEYTKANPDEALDILFRSTNTLSKTNDYEFQKRSLSKALQYVGNYNEEQTGLMKKDVWLGMENDLFNINKITTTGYIQDLCDFEVVKEAYEE